MAICTIFGPDSAAFRSGGQEDSDCLLWNTLVIDQLKFKNLFLTLKNIGRFLMNFKHGNSRNPLYAVWRTMLHRCYNPKNHKFPSYGARGISVCERWRNSFEAFLIDMGERPIGMSIERQNNDGNYEPNNCIWATPLQQSLNRRKKTHCKRGHLLTDIRCVVCNRDRNKKFMRGVRSENPDRWR